MNPRCPWTCATIVALTLAAPPARAQTPPSQPPAAGPVEAPAEAPAEKPRDFAGPEDAAPVLTHDALRAFEGGFEAGQALLERGESLAAARTWAETATLLPEQPEHRDNRAAVFSYIAEAYERALTGTASREQLTEALTALDRYADTFTATYGDDAPLGPRVVTAREAFRTRLAALEPVVATPVVPKPVVMPPPPPPMKVETRGWKGLAVGGGVALGVGVGALAMMIAGAVRGRALTRRFDEPSRGCDRNAPIGECGEIFRAGQAMNTHLIAGAVIGALGIAAGSTLVVLAHRRRTASSATPSAAPSVGPGFAGLVLQGRF